MEVLRVIVLHVLLQVSCEGAFEVVDFSSLTLQPVVDPVVLNATVSIQHHQQVSHIFLSLSLSLRVCRSLCVSVSVSLSVCHYHYRLVSWFTGVHFNMVCIYVHVLNIL